MLADLRIKSKHRTAGPDDIANLVSFLVSEGAGFVSGQVIYAAGGPTN